MEAETLVETSQRKAAALCVSGWLIGCSTAIIALFGLLAWSGIHMEAHPESSARLLIGLSSVLFAALGTWVGGYFYRPYATHITYAIMVTFIAIGLFSWVGTNGKLTWPMGIFICCMGNAANFTRLEMIRRSDKARPENTHVED